MLNPRLGEEMAKESKLLPHGVLESPGRRMDQPRTVEAKGLLQTWLLCSTSNGMRPTGPQNVSLCLLAGGEGTTEDERVGWHR